MLEPGRPAAWYDAGVSMPQTASSKQQQQRVRAFMRAQYLDSWGMGVGAREGAGPGHGFRLVIMS